MMTDKEQINKCECTCDECGAECEPFWGKENKEQIIIDGVDVSRCKYLPYCNDKQGNCAFEPNCYFKQLARKTQECEELKKKLNTSEEWRIKAESLNEKQDLENTRYRKALEEMRGLLKTLKQMNVLMVILIVIIVIVIALVLLR